MSIDRISDLVDVGRRETIGKDLIAGLLGVNAFTDVLLLDGPTKY